MSEPKKSATRVGARKQAGFALTSELVLLSTVSVLGLTVGLVSLRDAVTAELNDVAGAIGALNQSYAFDGILNDQGTAQLDGSLWVDGADALGGDGLMWTYVTPAIDEATTLPASVGALPSTGASSDAADLEDRGGSFYPEP